MTQSLSLLSRQSRSMLWLAPSPSLAQQQQSQEPRYQSAGLVARLLTSTSSCSNKYLPILFMWGVGKACVLHTAPQKRLKQANEARKIGQMEHILFPLPLRALVCLGQLTLLEGIIASLFLHRNHAHHAWPTRGMSRCFLASKDPCQPWPVPLPSSTARVQCLWCCTPPRRISQSLHKWQRPKEWGPAPTYPQWWWKCSCLIWCCLDHAPQIPGGFQSHR